MRFLEELASRRRFGMKPGLDTIRRVCAALGHPEARFPAVHIAGTNGKGATAAILERAFIEAGMKTGRYTSPHLVSLNERFFLDGAPVCDETLDRLAAMVPQVDGLTFFEALTAVAFLLYAEAGVDVAVLETGLGGRLDATNVCSPRLCVITRIGLDHCGWLGDTVEKIAAEKAGIIKPSVPVVLGGNATEVREIVEARARELGAPFSYAPSIASESDIPADFPLAGAFNRENAVTAIAALKVLGVPAKGFGRIVWPGRYQKTGEFIVDGAHNPPAAKALAAALEADGVPVRSLNLIAGFCGDKDVHEVLKIIAPFVRRGYAVKTGNPRSLPAAGTSAMMRLAGIDSRPCESLDEAISLSRGSPSLVCGSLFLAGEALVALGAFPWRSSRFDPSEALS
ncbi:MAG: bifunctional folylpolyglutamate synthase/dihydrofolate synthase [Kiritimatiellae bacterium]|nr:bifunctional folylpolyglutamate synthase/dihydrofolate synthase [Kiritimatiellia bacterium]